MRLPVSKLVDETIVWWWLRSPGNNDRTAAYVRYDGSVDGSGSLVYSAGGAVRPAMWIDISNS